MSLFDEDAARVAYEDVRSDQSDTAWAVLKYEVNKLEELIVGQEYDDLRYGERVYAYVRFETGDEMSLRSKFAFITWIGPGVSPLKKAKVSTDKAFVKRVWTDFGKEILADEIAEVDEDKIKKILEAASGAAYGTGK